MYESLMGAEGFIIAFAATLFILGLGLFAMLFILSKKFAMLFILSKKKDLSLDGTVGLSSWDMMKISSGAHATYVRTTDGYIRYRRGLQIARDSNGKLYGSEY